MVIEEEFFSAADLETGFGPSAGEESGRIDHDHVLDLNDAVRQYAMLSTPMKLTWRRGPARESAPPAVVTRTRRSAAVTRAVRDSSWGPLLDLVSSPGSVKDYKS